MDVRGRYALAACPGTPSTPSCQADPDRRARALKLGRPPAVVSSSLVDRGLHRARPGQVQRAGEFEADFNALAQGVDGRGSQLLICNVLELAFDGVGMAASVCVSISSRVGAWSSTARDWSSEVSNTASGSGLPMR